MKYILFLTLAFGATSVANSQTVNTLFSTGLDAFGNPLAAGSIDPNYFIIESGTNAEILTNVPSSYLPNDVNSQWIWQQSNGQPTNVTRTFRTTFDLTGFDSNTAVINGLWGVDNQGIDILINGISTGNSLLGVLTSNFSQLHSFQIVDGFQSGINTLDFIIQDNGSVSAFRADLSGTASVVPIPGALWLFLSGLAIVGTYRRKSKFNNQINPTTMSYGL